MGCSVKHTYEVKEFNLHRLFCKFCDAEYYIKWVDILSAKKYAEEFCPNCGETGYLELIETIKIC